MDIHAPTSTAGSVPRLPGNVGWDPAHVTAQRLPSCQRCKRLRRKCDTRLPSCRQCEKTHAECTIYDPALQQVLPRSYVHSLLQRLDSLKTLQAAVALETARHEGNGIDQQRVTDDQVASALPTPPSASGSVADHKNFDLHFPIPTTNGYTFRFHGSSSVFSLAVEVFSRAYAGSWYTPISEQDRSADMIDPMMQIQIQSTLEVDVTAISREMIYSLLSLYMSSTNTIYPFIDDGTMRADSHVYFSLHQSPNFDPGQLNGTEAYQYFRISMMCAIACANKARYQPEILAHGRAFYSAAMKCAEEVTSEASAQSLRAILMLVLYCLFYPRQGDIWKLLDFACRLSVELGYHTEGHDSEDEGQKDLRRNCFWGLYAIERIVGQLFGRPSDLPEPIITTEYPRILTVGSPENQATVQTFTAAHHYRLVYLRSEIYKEVYLHINQPLPDMAWFKDRYRVLRQWYREIDTSTDVDGCGTVTCRVAYHSSIIFLFQPLILHSLSSTRSRALGPLPDNLTFIPSDNYFSSCALIKTYEAVIRASAPSDLTSYPMTFLSAHYIWLAAMTIMAHVQLDIDGRVQTYEPWGDDPDKAIPLPIDYREVFDVTGSCLILLSWCAERWEGMGGMLDAFKRLNQKVLPMLVQTGLVVYEQV